jgi:DMATS type aromatic prenyltransferase
MLGREPTISDGGPTIRERSPIDFVVDMWDAACRSLALSETGFRPISKEIRSLLSSWKPDTIGEASNYKSQISDDGFPAELSVNWKGSSPQVRILFESLGDPPTPRSCRQAWADLTKRIASSPGVSLERYLAVKDLFAADSNDNDGFIWHSLAWTPGHSPDFKVYFNAEAQGRQSTYDLVDEAMRRLDLGLQWRHVRDGLGRHGQTDRGGPRLQYFGLDLANTPTSRIKVYFRHCSNSFEELNAIARLASAHDRMNVLGAYRQILGDRNPANAEHLTCLAFLVNHSRPAWSSTYFRLPGLGPEKEITKRIAALMRARGMDPAQYLAMMSCISSQRDSAAREELISIKSGQLEPDFTVYLRFNVRPQHVSDRTCSTDPKR